MQSQNILKLIILFYFSLIIFFASGQTVLPPITNWNGKSEHLITDSNNPWITPSEISDFKITPNYNETINWFKKLTSASPILSMVSIGKSVEGRDIFMIIASTNKNISAESLKKSGKPLVLAQAGIHSGEIDGKDAGMMLLRDIAFWWQKRIAEKCKFSVYTHTKCRRT